MALTFSQLSILPVDARPRHIKVSDRGGAIYHIEQDQDGSTATPVIPDNNDARAAMGLGAADPVTFSQVSFEDEDLTLKKYATGVLGLVDSDGNTAGTIRAQNFFSTNTSMTFGSNALQVSGNSAINQDLRTTASPTWAGINSTANIGVQGSVRITSNSAINAFTLGSASDVQFRRSGASRGAVTDVSGTPIPLDFGGGTSSGPVTITDTTASALSVTGGISVGTSSIISGVTLASGTVAAGTGSSVTWSGRARMFSPSSDDVSLRSQGNSDFASLLAKNATLSGSLSLPRTVIPAGTTGAQTINTATGKVRFAAGATTLVVTNSLATVNSIIFPNLDTSDITAKYAEITPANGSFTIRLNAAATAECTVSFGILTP